MLSADITPHELSELIEQGQEIFMLDVRDPSEFEFCQILGSINIPLTNLMQDLHKIDQNLPIVTICHHGYRSNQAAYILRENGFCNVANLKGGIDAWSQNIDPTVKRY